MTALSTAVATATAAVARLYQLNAVPESPTYPYGAWSAMLGRGDSYTKDSRYGVRWGRIVVQTFGRTSDAATDWADKVATALLDKNLTISGYRTTPCRIELDPVVNRDPDTQGVVGVTTTFTFTAAKES